ncbi:MAG: cell division protein ZipA [Oleiphilus sp.]|nr:MAG: cell division protein ZipA [Oleiphilus sp.]
MDFRDWLIIVGIVIILGILADGYRRMRLARMDSLKMSRNMGAGIENSPLDDDFNPELPGGGARVVASGTEDVESEFPESEPEHQLSASPDIEVDEPVQAEMPLSADSEDRVNSGGGRPDRPVVAKASVKKPGGDKPSAAKASGTNSVAQPEAQDNAGDREVIVINVDAKADQIFLGADIKKLLEACGMEHGDMSIFHRHEENDLLSPIQFSVANAVEPGYFDPSKMEQLVTPGVSFFMSLPGPKDYMKAFDYMLETAQCFASNLGGDLSDERRSVLTKQTIEHFRHRVREFERKQLSKSKA